ncbi:MAG TPA: carboxylesterase family protein [Caulobacteraceae bacterium]|jgi:para-nitrobenzyl esterase|nr:carboxylesterase family protein [Caulobacteraceae bacterium]
MLQRIAATLLAALALGSAARAAEVDAHIDTGVVAGQANGAVEVFKGVPFAAPPTGPLRWKPPQPAAPWIGVRDASAYGPACPQVVDPSGHPNGGGYAGPTSEDCLNLNVFAPVGAHRAPVMVWIFGGGNSAGANSIAPNDGTAFARDGVILVSVNYRLGALGFFAHPALTRAAGPAEPLGSYGTMDQIAALKWVRRNIKAFGGDPDNVTIFGESAGGWDTLTLMATPAARGLFAKATVQSGGGWSAPVSLAAAEADGVAMAKTLGLPEDATAGQLRALPVEALVGAHGRFNPIVDGRLITENATQAFARGDQAPVPLIIGSNSWEASLLPPAGYAAYLAGASPATRAAYADQAGDDARLAQALFTDAAMGAPARWIAARASAKAPAWLYYFSYVRVVRRGKIPGANHTSENPYVFDSQMGIPNYSNEIVDDDRALARVMHSCWVAFAKTGVPACSGAPAWPAYTPASDRLMEFGITTGARQHFRKPQLDAQEKAQGQAIGGR